MDGAFADVREAREFAARVAVGWSVHEVDDLCLVTSELTTNAVVHARTGFSVVVGLMDHSIVVEVTDGSDALPVLERYPSRCESGRGLLLVRRPVAAVGRRSGARREDGMGRARTRGAAAGPRPLWAGYRLARRRGDRDGAPVEGWSPIPAPRSSIWGDGHAGRPNLSLCRGHASSGSRRR